MVNTDAPASTRYNLRADLTAILLLLLALSTIYRRLLAGQVLAGGDLFTYFFPYWSVAARAVQEGRLPLWNAYLFAGAPLLANSQVGAFYPPNLLLWWLSGPGLEGAALTLHISILLHLALAGINSYLLARALGINRPGALLVGLIYAGSGYLGVQVEHLNQLQGLAWLPLTLLPWQNKRPHAVSILALGLILLAGHTQTAFITAVGITGYQLCTAWFQLTPAERRRPRNWITRLPALALFALAGLMAAVQLLPTAELARFSIRAGGLPWREAVSFSVAPWSLHRSLLPPYLFEPLLPEGVAYLGLIGLALAGWTIYRAVRSRDPRLLPLVFLAGLGLFLALGGYNPFYLLLARLGVPGIVQFRAPARFLALYVLAGSLLAGSALPEPGPTLRRRALPLALSGLLLLELLLSAESLPHAAATAARAYTSLRPATTRLVAAVRTAEKAQLPAGRFLSISKTLFEPGDEPEIRAIYGKSLSSQALWTYLVAAKHREVLAPNLALAFRVPALDGYDGGLLPMRPYATFSRLLLPEGTLDGRLRENLTAIPQDRWLELLDIQRLITDKTADTWAEGIYYDRQFQPALTPESTFTPGWLPADFSADSLRLFYQGAGDLEITLRDGRRENFTLPPAPTSDLPVTITWAFPTTPLSLTLRASTPGLTLTGMTLVDSRDGSFYPLTASDRYRLIHSGDVKIYETVTPYPHARLIYQAQAYPDDEAALKRLSAPDFDPTTELTLADCTPIEGTVAPLNSPASVAIQRYTDTEIELAVQTATPGYLLLKDAWYPGWEATLTPTAGGQSISTPICRADLWLRAAVIPAGDWKVTFRYHSSWLLPGAVISLIGFLLWLAIAWKKKPVFSRTF